MNSVHATRSLAQRARMLIALATIAIAVFGAPLAAHAVTAPLAAHAVTAPQTPHAATPHYSAPSSELPLADATPNTNCGAIVLPC